MKTFQQFCERALTKSEEEKKEEIVMSMKDKKSEFKKRYGDDWKSVMYATATKIAQKGEAYWQSDVPGQLKLIIETFSRELVSNST